MPIKETTTAHALAASRESLDMDTVLRQLAVTIANHDSSVKQLMDVLHLWTQLVVRRDKVSGAAAEEAAAGTKPIVDLVEISPVALARQAN